MVGGLTRDCLALADAIYSQVVVKTVPVSSTRVAESTKLLENIFRAVNIALEFVMSAEAPDFVLDNVDRDS